METSGDHRISRRSFLVALGSSLLVAGCAAPAQNAPTGKSPAAVEPTKGPQAGSAGSPTASSSATAPATTQPLSTKARKPIVCVDSMEPKSYVDGGIYPIREGIGEGLIKIDFEGKYAPSLATEWKQVDPITWRISLRPGVTFHNGNKFDAEAVKWSLERLAGRKEANSSFQGASVTVENPSTVLIKTRTAVPFLTAILADSNAVILDRSSYEKEGASARPIGTGPFKLMDFKPGDRRVLESFDSYWGGVPGVSGVQYLMVPQGQTRTNMIRTGEADIARLINTADVPSLKTNQAVEVLTVALPRVRTLFPNVRKGPTSDLRVRQAMAHAIDREIIVKTVLENQSSSQATLFSPGQPWANPAIKGLPFDPEKSKALLAEAGYSASKPLSLTMLTYSSRPELPEVAQVVQQQFSKVGISCEISVQQMSVIESTAFKSEHELILMGRNPLFLYDPQGTFESDFATTGSYNLSGYDKMDGRIKTMAEATDNAVRYDMCRQMEKQIIEDDVATIVLNSYIQIDAVHKGTTGYRPHPMDYMVLTADIAKS